MRLIVVDGLDGSGKDAHAERIKRLLETKGERVVVVSHPSQRLVGRMSRRALQRTGGPARLLATLFFTADVLVSVRRHRRQGAGTAIFVRYLMGTAYLPPRLAPHGYVFFRKLLPFPDLALFIDTDPRVALRRIQGRDRAREMFETEEKLASVRKVARALASSEWVTIDNSEDGERSFMEVEALLRKRKII